MFLNYCCFILVDDEFNKRKYLFGKQANNGDKPLNGKCKIVYLWNFSMKSWLKLQYIKFDNGSLLIIHGMYL